MSTNANNVNPRGAGHEPTTDPWKGFRGVCSGTLVLEAIIVLLVLTVVARVDGGAHMAWWKAVYILVVAGGMIYACAQQKKPWAIPLNLGLAMAVVIGFFVHYTMTIVGVIFLLVWLYLLFLRSQLRQRIAGGYLASQHD